MNRFIKAVKEENKAMDELEAAEVEEDTYQVALEALQFRFRYRLYEALLPFQYNHNEENSNQKKGR